MKRRNLIGSLLAGAGVFLTGRPLRAASAAGVAVPQADREESANGSPETASGSPASATVRVIYANATQASWEAVTNGGILVAGATNISGGNLNLRIIHDAVTAIVAAGGPTLTRSQVALFGGQN
ncbi:MAG TPA: hypothetical protein VGW33_05930 [Terriglobia bacterium]|nr:hypothetical protein [Terriglobia bacterium]